MNIKIIAIAQLKWSLLVCIQAHMLIFVWKIMNKQPKFEIGDHVRIIKYKSIFPKCCAQSFYFTK